MLLFRIEYFLEIYYFSIELFLAINASKAPYSIKFNKQLYSMQRYYIHILAFYLSIAELFEISYFTPKARSGPC